jgi:hypothetical protein
MGWKGGVVGRVVKSFPFLASSSLLSLSRAQMSVTEEKDVTKSENVIGKYMC